MLIDFLECPLKSHVWQAYIRNARPLLLDHFPESKVDEIESNAIAEIRSLDRPASWVRTTIVCARRIPLARDFRNR